MWEMTRLLNDLLRDIANDKNKFSLANFLTLSRLIFLPFILYHLTYGTLEHDRWAAFFMFLAGITDFFDGYVARKYNQASYLGRLLDPIVDKVSIGIVMVFLTVYNDLPLWYTMIVIGRDIIILCGGIYIMVSKSFIVQ
jgi:CDP-diacylglycerol--glycerol-3-phosphate 3-phosphatidyltransferase